MRESMSTIIWDKICIESKILDKMLSVCSSQIWRCINWVLTRTNDLALWKAGAVLKLIVRMNVYYKVLLAVGTLSRHDEAWKQLTRGGGGATHFFAGWHFCIGDSIGYLTVVFFDNIVKRVWSNTINYRERIKDVYVLQIDYFYNLICL